ncbi:MAG: hypothetical protein HON12_08915 [Flavobacteriales bacterium]|nr:hypothetical protein [Flavobacteriales bacterium]
MNRILIVLFVLLGFSGKSQSPADWWYFGQEAGIHFTSTGPVAVTDGVMTTQEGCASISSAQGEKQFYTDGTSVWDSTHTVMPNGDSLLGNLSSTQSAVIVPYPGASHKYCIFTVRGCTGGSTTGPLGYYFAYSVVDMTLNAGLGDVLVAEKNIILFDSSAEKCTAMLHANGSDIWVLGHEQYTDKFHAYRLTSSGIVDTVTSPVGSIHTSCVSYMLANHSGDQVAVANFGTGAGVEMFDFNQQTGVVSDPDTIQVTPAYGIHFSPNDSVLYAGYTSGIYQYDLSAPLPQSTQYLVSDVSTYAIAEGPDEKLYSTRYTTSYLAAINEPNELGAACLFQDSAVYLEGRICRIGLPNNVASGIFAISQIQISSFCFGDSTIFSVDTTNVDSLFWVFGDPASGSANTSGLINPAHLYTDSGSYTVMVIAHLDTIIDTAYQTIFIYPRQSVDLGDDTTICAGDTLTLSAAQPYATFEWSIGSTNAMIDVIEQNYYGVTVTGACDTVFDSIYVAYDSIPIIDLGLILNCVKIRVT